MAIRDVNVRILTTASASEVTKLTEQINALKESLQGLTRSQESGGNSAFSNELKSVQELTDAFKDMSNVVREGMREQQETVRAGYNEMTEQARIYVQESTAMFRESEITKREEIRATGEALVAEQQRIQEENTAAIMAAAAVQINAETSKNEKLIEQYQIRADKEVEIEKQKNALILAETMANAAILTTIIENQTKTDIATKDRESRETIALLQMEQREKQTAWQQAAQWAAEIDHQIGQAHAEALRINRQMDEEDLAYQKDKAAQLKAAFTEYQNAEIAAYTENVRREKELTQEKRDAEVRAYQEITDEARAAAEAQRAVNESLSNSLTMVNEAFTRARETVNSFATTLREGISAGLTVAREAVATFGESVSSVFSGIRERVSSAGGIFASFGGEVESSMNRGERAMQSFYASGWTLVMLGQQISMVGHQIMSGLGQDLNNFLGFEKNITQASIASTVIDPATGKPMAIGANGQPLANNSTIIEQGIFDMQRKGVEINGQLMPVWTQTADQLAKGVYILASATGEQIKSADDMRVVSERLVPMLQAAAITQTDPESAIKGFLAASMEFGINPADAGKSAAERDATTARMNETVAAMMSVTQKTPLEMTDIVNTMKMLGPIAHFFSGDTTGKDLMDTLALAGTIGQEGLRGGQVGRGLQMIIASETGATPKMDTAIEAAFAGSTAGQTFLDESGHLKGGVLGTIAPLEALYEQTLGKDKAAAADAMTKLTNILNAYTANGRRDIMAALAGIHDVGGLEAVQKISAELQGTNPLRMLSENILQQHDTIFGNLDNLRNAWFAMQSSIIAAIEGPLKTAIKSIANVVWDVQQKIAENPWLGKIAAGVAVFSGLLLSVVGTLLTFSGGIILVAGALSKMGGAMEGVETILTIIPALLSGLLPVMIVGILAGIAAWDAWQTDLGHVQERVANFGTTLREVIVPALVDVANFVLHTATAFEQLVSAIGFGTGGTNDLQAWLLQIFGPDMGGAIMAQLDRFQTFMAGVRASLMDFFGNVPGYAASAASAIESFASRGITAFVSFIQSIANSSMIQSIFSNFASLFTGANFSALADLGSGFLQGFAEGFAGAIAGALRLIQVFSQLVALVPSLTGQFGDFIDRVTGLNVSMRNLGEAVGIGFGAFMGGRFVSEFTPILSILDRLATTAVTFGLRVGEVGVKIAAMLVQGALWATQLAATTVITLGQAAATLAMSFAEDVAEKNFIKDTIALLGETEAKKLDIIATLELEAATDSLYGTILLGIAAFAALAVGIAVLYVKSQDFRTGFNDVILVFAGIIKAVYDAAAVIAGPIIGALQALTDKFGGSKLAMEAFGAVMAAVVIAALLAVLAPIAAAIAGFIELGVSMLIDAAPFIGAIAAIGLAVYGLIEVIKHFGDIWNWVKNTAMDALHAITSAGDKTTLTQQVAAYNNAKYMAEVQNNQKIADEAYNWVDYYNAHPDQASPQFLKLPYDQQLDYAQQQIAITGYGSALATSQVDQNVLNSIPKVTVVNADGTTQEVDILTAAKLQAQQNQATTAAGNAPTMTSADNSGWMAKINDWKQQAANAIKSVASGTGLDSVYKILGLAPGSSLANLDMSQIIKITGAKELQGQWSVSLADSLSGLGPDDPRVKAKINEQTNLWNDVLASFGGNVQKALAYWHENYQGKAPIETGFAEAIKADQKAIDAAAKDWADASANVEKVLSQATLPDIMQMLMEKSNPNQTESLGLLFAQQQQSLDSFLSNYHYGSGSGTNTQDLISHATTSFVGKAVAGTDIATLIKNDPGIQHWAAEAGVAIPDLIAQVIKQNSGSMFIFDPRLMPAATMDLNAFFEKMKVSGKDQVIQDLNDKLDINWDELMHFAASEGAKKWNLTDFFKQQWGMTTDQVNAILKENGIKPEDVSSALFPDVTRQIETSFGQVNILTAEEYKNMQNIIKNATVGANGENVITLSKQDWEGMSTAEKIALEAAGYILVEGADSYAKSKAKHDKTIDDANSKKPKPIPLTQSDYDNANAGASAAFAASGIYAPPTTYTVPTEPVQNIAATLTKTPAQTVGEQLDDAKKVATTKGAELHNIVQTTMSNLWNFDTAPVAAGGSKGTATGAGIPVSTAGPLDATFKSYADSALKAFSTEMTGPNGIQAQVQLVMAQLGAGGQPSMDGGRVQAAAAGPFDGVFKGYADAAVKAFNQELSVAFPGSVTKTLDTMYGGGSANGNAGAGAKSGGGGPFDGIFKGYADSAATAFGGELGPKLQTAMTQAIAGISGQSKGVATGAGIPMPGAGSGGPLDAHFTNMASSAVTAFMGILTGSSGKGLGMSDQVGEMLTGIPPSGSGDTLNQRFTTLAQNAVQAFEKELETINVAVDNVLSGLESSVDAYDTNAWNAGFNLGFNVGAGVVNGINSQLGAVTAAAANLALASTGAFARQTGQASPSKVFMRMGSYLGEGLVIGMDSTHPAVAASAAGMANAAITGGTIRPSGGAIVPARGQAGGGIVVRIDNVTITKEADVDKVYNRIETLMGQKMELVARGQTSFEIGNFGSTL